MKKRGIRKGELVINIDHLNFCSSSLSPQEFFEDSESESEDEDASGKETTSGAKGSAPRA